MSHEVSFVCNDSFSFLVVVHEVYNLSIGIELSFYIVGEEVSNSSHNDLPANSVINDLSGLTLAGDGGLGLDVLPLLGLLIEINAEDLSSEGSGSASNHGLLCFSVVAELDESEVLSWSNIDFLDKTELGEEVNELILRSANFKSFDEKVVEFAIPLFSVLVLVSLDSYSVSRDILVVEGIESLIS